MAVESEEEDLVIRMINSASALRSETLDLGSKCIYKIPNEILNLKHLESLHLQSNYITELPDEFFLKLTNLKWLDLRNNRLSSLPVSVGKHRTLRSLLLEGNSLTHLPCELGMTRSICGLSLSGNPLEFPPSEIIQKGTKEILKYLREMCDNSAWTKDEVNPLPGAQSDEESDDTDNTSNHRKGTLQPLYTTHDFPEPLNTPSTFHPPPKRIDQLRYEYDKLRVSSSGSEESRGRYVPRRRASVDEVSDQTLSDTRRQRKKLDSVTTPASATTLREAKASRERRLRRTASLNQKESVLQQRIKNKLALDDWRNTTRSLQQKKQYQALRKGVTKVKVPSPFATEDTEKTNGTQRKVHEYNKKLQELLELNDKEITKKVLKDRELETRIRNHIEKIHEQRRPSQPISEEVEETKNNLELAHKLHEELNEKREMEYRLRAFTGDDFVLNSRYYKNHR
ncbi:leucine-rich repeat-containing protein 27-like isoform X2 [Dendronephthya gigantea]|uniref:leucine-rich repeat-containing protein 27-like isoform X2 n=1 Tax=Dendronephthya gigantea TaxID=151771 RepID=UPI00106C32C7|nr:leucine-rich repeat-containing protein 27-like isoform X2 [Dendronephthya gigantea]